MQNFIYVYNDDGTISIPQHIGLQRGKRIFVYKLTRFYEKLTNCVYICFFIKLKYK